MGTRNHRSRHRSRRQRRQRAGGAGAITAYEGNSLASNAFALNKTGGAKKKKKGSRKPKFWF